MIMSKSKRPPKKGPLILGRADDDVDGIVRGCTACNADIINQSTVASHSHEPEVRNACLETDLASNKPMSYLNQNYVQITEDDLPSQSRSSTTDQELKAGGSTYTVFDAFLTVFAMCGYLFDLGSDIFVAIMHYRYAHYWWFGLTVSFIVLPSLAVTGFSVAWYVQDRKTCKAKESTRRWVLRYFLVAIQLGPVMRYIDTLVYGLRGRKAGACHKLLVRDQQLKQKQWEETDATLQRLLKCFMEAAPQLTLQLYIMIREGVSGHVVLVIGQSFSCITSLCSLSWSMVAYQNNLRLALEEKQNLSYPAMVPMFLWRVFTIGARVVAFTLFASCFTYWLFVLVGCHFVVMFVWILLQNTNFCENSVEEFFFNIVTAVMHIFCFFNLVEGHTRLRYTIFYVLVYLENMAMILTWYFLRPLGDPWYVTPAMVAVLGLFFAGVFFQVFYYLVCHPNNYAGSNNRIRLCVSCFELFDVAWNELLHPRENPQEAPVDKP